VILQTPSSATTLECKAGGASKQGYSTTLLQRPGLRHISVSGANSENSVRLRLLLEKLILVRDGTTDARRTGGLGSNNFYSWPAIILLLPKTRLPVLLIENRKHISPSTPVTLKQFSNKKADESEPMANESVNCHEHSRPSFSYRPAQSGLLHGGQHSFRRIGTPSLRGLRFLPRFLDVTKAIFFARDCLLSKVRRKYRDPTHCSPLDRDLLIRIRN